MARRSRRPTEFCANCAWVTPAIRSPANFPMAASGSWRSPWRSQPGRKFCFSKSPLPSSRKSKAANSSKRWRAFPTISRCFSLSTTCMWYSASQATSLCWSAVQSSLKVHRRKSQPIQACARSIWANASMADSLLKLENVTAGYGDAVVLHGISLDLPEHGSLALLGRNGVGKSTLLMTIMGYTQLRSGRVVWKGQDISRLPPNRRAMNGIGWVAQEREIFPSLSVEENLTVASRPGPWDLDAVFKLFPRLSERQRNMGNQLSGGEQQMLAIARALMTNPALMLLDEPFEGLAPVIVDELAAAMKTMLSDRRIAIILVEQHTDIALELTAEAIVLERGAVAHRAPSAQLQKDTATLERLVGLRVAATA